jgi:hypothetical protein
MGLSTQKMEMGTEAARLSSWGNEWIFLEFTEDRLEVRDLI